MLHAKNHQLYPEKEGPRYVRGHAVSLSMVGFAVVLAGLLWLYYVRENALRCQGKRDDSVADLTDEEKEELGDDAPTYIYNT